MHAGLRRACVSGLPVVLLAMHTTPGCTLVTPICG
jgi:hypothetical protein